jgi:MFS family permease
MTIPGQTVGVSAFFDPITQQLGLSRQTVAWAYTFGTLLGLLPAPLIGRMIDRHGPRQVASVVAAGLAAACVGMSLAQSPVTLFLGFTLLRCAAVAGLSLVSLHVVNLWFIRRRGVATAAATLGLALGAVVFPRLIDQLIAAVGWRGAYLTLALIVAATILPIAVIFFRDRPELFGRKPDLGVELSAAARAEPSFTRAQALKTGMFWLLNAASFLSNGIGTGLLLHHFSIMASEGFSRTQALAVLTPLALTQAVATLGTGMLLDRWQPRRVLPLSMLSLAAGCVLAQFMGAVGTAVFYGVAIGAALGCFHAINASAYAHYFGRTHLGEIRGISFVTGVMGAACGPLPFAVQDPIAGAYDLVLTLSALACASVAIASFLVREPTQTTT